MSERRSAAVVLAAGLVAAVLASAPSRPAAAAPEAPVLRHRPSDAVLDDGRDHVIVHAGDRAPAGDGVVSAEPLGGGDWSLVLERGTDPSSIDGVEAVTADVWLDPYRAVDDPHLGQAWGIDNDGRSIAGWPGVADADVDATSAWDRAMGAGVVVAVIDSGVDRTHPDLRDRMWVNVDETCGDGDDDDGNGYVDDCDGWDFLRGDNTPFDPGVDSSHGTHVAGTIAATADDGFGVAGVAPAATIMGLKVSEGPSFRLSDALAALNYAVANGADVVNASWGTTGISRAELAPLEAAVERARQAGVVIVAAAGNDARDIDVSPSFPASFPQENVIAVAASTNAEANASFSNFGRSSVDLHAPGWFVLSTMPGGGHGYMSGTSMASPHVAGAAALARAADPAAGPAELRAVLLGTVDRWPAFDGRTATGGRLNAASAVGASDLPVALRFRGEPGAWVVDAQAGDEPSGPVAYRVGLATVHQGTVYAVTDHEVVLGGVATTTDEAGWAASLPFAGGALDGARLTVEADLPEGEYSLVVGVVAAETGEAVGPPQATFGSIAGPEPEPVPAPPPTTPPTPAPPPTTEAPPADGYEPAPLPPGGQPVPPSPTEPAPCASCGAVPPPEPPPSEPVPWPSEPDPRPPVEDDAPPWSPPPDEPVPWTPPADDPWTPPVDDSPPWSPPPPEDDALPWTPPVDDGPPPSEPAPSPPPVPWSPPVSEPPSSPEPVPAPTTTAPLAPPPDGAGPEGPFGITAVEPASGRAAGGTLVTIRGTAIPGDATVTFGGTPSDVSVRWGPEMLLVETRTHLPGTVDVVVRGGGTMQTIPAAFTYVADDPDVPVPPTTSTTTTAAPPPTTAPAPPTTAPTAPTAPTTSTTAPTPDEPSIVEARGLRLAPVPAGHPLTPVRASSWPALRCHDGGDGCAGTVLRWGA